MHLGEHGRVVLGLAADDAGAVDQDVEAGQARRSALRPRFVGDVEGGGRVSRRFDLGQRWRR